MCSSDSWNQFRRSFTPKEGVMFKLFNNDNDSSDSSLAVEMLMDSVIMAKYAVSNGLKIPEQIGLRLMEIEGKIQTSLDRLQTLRSRKKLLKEDEKEKHELELKIGETILTDLSGLTEIHGKLSEIVSPATPRSIVITEPAIGIKGRIMRIPLFRRMLILSGVFLLGYIISKYYPVDFSGVLLSMSLFFKLILKQFLYQIHIICAAGLGSAFHGLFTANRYLVNRTYDTKYSQSYWNRFWLGIIAGFILTNVIIHVENINIPTSAVQMTPTIIALLGGFSSDVVYRILRRLVEMLVTLVRGETQDIIAAREKEFEVKLKEKYAQKRIRSAASLSQIYQEVSQKLKPESADRLKEIYDSLLEESDQS